MFIEILCSPDLIEGESAILEEYKEIGKFMLLWNFLTI
jgi:hypothetical protein